MPKTHGKRYIKLYYIWSNMKDRCLNKNCKNYPSYGERDWDIDKIVNAPETQRKGE